MTRYILDTSTLIDYSKNVEPTRSRISTMIAAGDELCTCAVIVAEFYSGLPPAERPVWDAFLGSFYYLDQTWDIAVGAGADRYANARVGRPLAVTDTLIAAVARVTNAVIVTNNVKDFPTAGVQVISLQT